MVSESDTAITLPLIGGLTYREIHAVEDGFYCGIHQEPEGEYGQESHYWRTAWVLGDLYDKIFR